MDYTTAVTLQGLIIGAFLTFALVLAFYMHGRRP